MRQALFASLLNKQYILDKSILINHRLEEKEGKLIKEKIISLEVELSELANELRFFKYWSKKPANREKALFEYVDGLHFYLSVANDLQIREHEGILEEADGKDLMEVYFHCKQWALRIYSYPVPKFAWNTAFGWFLALGEKVGFTEDEVYQAYLDKNEINHERQANGY